MWVTLRPPIAAGGAPSPSPAATNGWRPEAAIVDQLSPYQDVEGFEIRLPKDFILVKGPERPLPGISIRLWKGAERENGGRPNFEMKIITPPPQALQSQGTPTVESGLEGVMPPEDIRGADFQKEAPEFGQINGASFVRSTFHFTWKGTDGKVQGAGYSGRIDNTWIQFRIHDYEPYHAETLKLMNAAVMTLRKK